MRNFYLRAISVLLCVSMVLCLFTACSGEKTYGVVSATSVKYNNQGKYTTVLSCSNAKLYNLDKDDVTVFYSNIDNDAYDKALESAENADTVSIADYTETTDVAIDSVVADKEKNQLTVSFTDKKAADTFNSCYQISLKNYQDDVDVFVEFPNIDLIPSISTVSASEKSFNISLSLADFEYKDDITTDDITLYGAFENLEIKNLTAADKNISLQLEGEINKNAVSKHLPDGYIDIDKEALVNAYSSASAQIDVTKLSANFIPESLHTENGKTTVELEVFSKDVLDSLTANDISFEEDVLVTAVDKTENNTALLTLDINASSANAAAEILDGQTVKIGNTITVADFASAGFRPIFDYVEQEGQDFVFTLQLYAKYGKFQNLTESSVSFAEGFENAKIIKIANSSDSVAELKFSVPSNEETVDTFNLDGTVILAEGSLINRWNAPAGVCSESREYSQSSMGKSDESDNMLSEMEEIMETLFMQTGDSVITETVENAADIVEELSDAIDEIEEIIELADAASEVSKALDNANEAVEAANKAIKAVDGASDVAKAAKKTANAVEDLSEASKDLFELAEELEDMAKPVEKATKAINNAEKIADSLENVDDAADLLDDAPGKLMGNITKQKMGLKDVVAIAGGIATVATFVVNVLQIVGVIPSEQSAVDGLKSMLRDMSYDISEIKATVTEISEVQTLTIIGEFVDELTAMHKYGDKINSKYMDTARDLGIEVPKTDLNNANDEIAKEWEEFYKQVVPVAVQNDNYGYFEKLMESYTKVISRLTTAVNPILTTFDDYYLNNCNFDSECYEERLVFRYAIQAELYHAVTTMGIHFAYAYPTPHIAEQEEVAEDYMRAADIFESNTVESNTDDVIYSTTLGTNFNRRMITSVGMLHKKKDSTVMAAVKGTITSNDRYWIWDPDDWSNSYIEATDIRYKIQSTDDKVVVDGKEVDLKGTEYVSGSKINVTRGGKVFKYKDENFADKTSTPSDGKNFSETQVKKFIEKMTNNYGSGSEVLITALENAGFVIPYDALETFGSIKGTKYKVKSTKEFHPLGLAFKPEKKSVSARRELSCTANYQKPFVKSPYSKYYYYHRFNYIGVNGKIVKNDNIGTQISPSTLLHFVLAD